MGSEESAASTQAGARPPRSGRLGFWLPLIFLYATVAGYYWKSLRRNDGHFTYAMDDAYIHMAIAKNLARHGVWGVTPFEFTSASSSPVWPFLLAGVDRVFGVNALAPLILNLLFASLALLASWRFLRSHGMAARWIFLVQLLVIYLTPLPFLIFDGMEHCLQTCVFILALATAAQYLASPPAAHRGGRLFALVGCTFLLSSIRYEAVFFAAALALLLLFRRRIAEALMVSVAAGAPILMFGVWCVRHGWPWLPTSVLMHSAQFGHPTLSSTWLRRFIVELRSNFEEGQHLVGLVVLSLVGYLADAREGRGIWDRSNAAAALFILTSLLHLTCATVGIGFRYEAYLMAAGILVVAAQARRQLNAARALPLKLEPRLARGLAVALLVGIFALQPTLRSVEAAVRLRWATYNIYEQQFQMARFIGRYYAGSAVALNDIGAVNYYGDIHCLDLAGLASLPIAKAHLSSTFNSEAMDRFAQQTNARIAIVYESWITDPNIWASEVPARWVPVGNWTITHNVIAGDDKVTFFAADPAEAPRLVKYLKEFSSRLPADVRQGGIYCDRADQR